MCNDKRFEVILKEGSQMTNDGSIRILVDKETGVNYFAWHSGYAGGITHLLNSDGKPITTDKF